MNKSATKERPSNTPMDDLLASQRFAEEQKLEEHQADMARRQAELDAKRPELILCLNPGYAKKRELEKPQYHWTVSGTWVGRSEDGITKFSGKERVIAQDEGHAWAKFCDLLGHWPSRRDCKPKIELGKQVTQAEVAANVASRSVEEDMETEFPEVPVGAKKRHRGL